MSELALFGGPKTRTTLFTNRPQTDEKEKGYVNDCLDNKLFSRFIGSPAGDFRRFLAMTSAEAVELQDFWSVMGGPYVRKFEAEFARHMGVPYAVSVNSATSGITAALLACGLKPGDEVITTPLSFSATATASRIAGGKIVFADIDPDTLCLTAETIEKRITPRTRAVVLVHFIGNAGDIVNIKALCDRKGIILVEDTAQALYTRKNGRFLGSFGHAGIFSFQETKNIMTGEGGMVITNDPKIAYKLRLIRNHGESQVYEGEDSPDLIEAAVGYNFRLPEPLAAIGYAQAQKMPKLNSIRRENFHAARKELERFGFLKPVRFTNDEDLLSPHAAAYSFEHPEIHRNTFADALRAEGIPVSTGYSRLLNENPYTKEDLALTPNAVRSNRERYLAFFQIGYPNTTDDMKDIGRAVAKLDKHMGELVSYDKKQPASRAFNSGRL